MTTITVNGAVIPHEAIQAEAERLGRDPQLLAIDDEMDRRRKAWAAAEQSLIGRALVEQAALADPRPISSDEVMAEVERLVARGASRETFEDERMRQAIETRLRVSRTLADLTAGAPVPREVDVQAFYQMHGHNFRSPDRIHAAHIVKHINEEQTEEQARAGIQLALEALERGAAFPEAAEQFSDCKGTYGDLGFFQKGTMVPEFEEVLDQLQPGERSGVFATPFGFHIAQLYAREPGSGSRFEDVRGDIERVLRTMAEHQAFLASVEQLRLQADIQVTTTD